VEDFGIRVTVIEPGGYSTDWAGPSAKHSTENPAYSEVRDARARSRARTQPGDPKASRAAILKVVDADDPPLRIFFGQEPLGVATADYESRLATWNKWQPVSVEAQGSA
jgi:NAD(P)-dependent dehydrogenase (short-subunit alcohol dehydrogenase family)